MYYLEEAGMKITVFLPIFKSITEITEIVKSLYGYITLALQYIRIVSFCWGYEGISAQVKISTGVTGQANNLLENVNQYIRGI